MKLKAFFAAAWQQAACGQSNVSYAQPSKLRSALASVFMLGFWLGYQVDPAVGTTITFDNYSSPTNDDLTNNFNQTGTFSTQMPYVQSPTGGISGGSVVGYLGSEYRATAVYNQGSFDVTAPGATVTLSLDIYWNAQAHPLAAGANAVRSFRLGILDSANSAFETFGNASAYIEGDYSFALQQMILIARSETVGPVTSIALSQVTLSQNDWYHIDVAFTNEGRDLIRFTGSLFDLGPNGMGSPVLLSTLDWSNQNADVASLTSAYVGFSALADGGISQIDNFSAPSAAPAPKITGRSPGSAGEAAIV